MAASSLNAVRVRLYFDYPPPGMPDCRMSWVLVDLNKCRVVADLCSVIREKFDYSRKTVLDLFIENCFLPPAESIHVVRDNDSIRVKVSGVSSEHVGKKRRRDEEGLIPTPAKKNRHAATETNGFPEPAGVTKKKKKHKAKKKKREGQQGECRDYVKAAVPAKESSSQTDKSTKKASASSCLTNEKASSSSICDKSSDSSDSSEKVPQKLSPNKSKRGTQVTASKCPAVRKFSFSKDKDENVPVKKSPKSTTCTSGKTPKGSTSSVPPKSSANSTAVKETQAESSSDLSSSQDEASATARNTNFLAKSVSVQQKSTTATSKAKPQTVTTSSSEEDDSESSTGRKSQVLQKSTSSLSKSVSSLQTQPTSSKISTSIKPSENPKTSKSQLSSDSSSSSEDEACDTSLPATPKPSQMAPALCATMENGVTPIPSTPVGTMLLDEEEKAERANSSSSSDTELVIKKPNPQLMIGLTPRGRGRGFTDRVKGRGGVRGGFGRARGTPWKQNFHYSFDAEEQRQRKDIQTNQSLLLQNPPEPSYRRDYSTLPLLAAAPAVGQKIAFKLLELTENYTPEVSDYKEGKIISFNHSTNVVELELLTPSQARTEPGKFDLVYEDSDGSERVEYAVAFGSQLTERWESLLEPRLIVQNTD